MATRVDIGFGDEPWLVGESRLLTFPVTDASDAAKSLAGASAVAWRWTNIAPAEGSPTTVLTKSLGSGVAVVDGAPQATMDEADTADLTPGDYYHELRATDAAGDTATTHYGYVRLTGSVH